MLVLLCCAVAVKLRTDCFPPPGGLVSIGPVPTFDVVVQLKITPLSGVAQVNSTVLPSLTFLDSGVTDSIMTASVPIINR